MPYLALPITPTAQFDAVCVRQINMLCADVHTMLRLPQPGVQGLEAGCNLATALTLLDMASGVSRVLSTNPNGIYGSSALFVDFFRDFFPWNEEPTVAVNGFQPIIGGNAADVLYESYRCPLAHRLGTVDAQKIGRLKVAKAPLTEDEIAAIETAVTRPQGEAPTIGEVTGQDARTVLNVPMLYWGLRKAVCAAVVQTAAARQVAPQQTGTPVPTHHVPTEVTNAMGSMANFSPPGTQRR
jgi:hypothetical protein